MFTTIKGQYLASGCSMGDYAVSVGNETCVVYDLTDNELLCSPPKQTPSAIYNQSNCEQHKGTLAVKVIVVS